MRDNLNSPWICAVIFCVLLYSWVEQDPSDPLSGLSTQFLRGLLTLGQLQQRNVLSVKATSAEQVYHTYVTNQKYCSIGHISSVYYSVSVVDPKP